VIDRRPSVLIVAAKWWSTSARLAIALARDGCRVGAIYPAGHPLKCISGIEYTRHYRGIRSLECLRRCIGEWHPDIVIPFDDGIVVQLHELHRQEPTLRNLIERSIGAPEGYAVVDSRFQLLNMAASLNIRVPRTVRVGGAQDLIDWHSNHEAISVLKVDGESGGNGVRISRSLEQSLAAWRELSMRPTAAHAWKRLIVDRDPLARWVRSHRGRREVTIQEYIVGRPANSMLACRQGAVISQASALVVASDGPTGAATIIRPMSDRHMALAGELLAAKLELSGFCGLDFIIEGTSGDPYLIEMNPRCTQLGHLEFAGQGSLVAALCADLKGESLGLPLHPVRPGPIALFPQAFGKIAALSPHLDSSYHDIPWEEPRLVQELMLEPWPIRRWVARLYHLFRPVSRLVPVEFEVPGPVFNHRRHRAVS
jgi:hypothetical protein